MWKRGMMLLVGIGLGLGIDLVMGDSGPLVNGWFLRIGSRSSWFMDQFPLGCMSTTFATTRPA